MPTSMIYVLLALISVLSAIGALIASIAVRRSNLLKSRRFAYAGFLLMASSTVFVVASGLYMLTELS